jgi:carbonic anhydrase/acetyltransferase-like protein (isoleucine patch superfamily)
MTTPDEVARSFSGHRFEEAFAHLAEDVRWVLVGQAVLVGRDAVVTACRATADQLVGTTTT